MAVLTWAGLRGGVSIALALTLPASEYRGRLLIVCYTVVVFSMLLQGLTMPEVIRRLYGRRSARTRRKGCVPAMPANARQPRISAGVSSVVANANRGLHRALNPVADMAARRDYWRQPPLAPPLLPPQPTDRSPNPETHRPANAHWTDQDRRRLAGC